MKLRGGIVVIISIFFTKSFATGDLTITGGRSASMGYTSVATADAWSGFNNQAGLSWSRKFIVGIYLENKFLIKEISLKAIGAVMPIKRGTWGLSFSHFGYSQYNEIKAGLAYSMLFGKKFSAGLQFDYLRMKQGADYGSRNIVTFEIGFQFRITGRLNLGVHIYNPFPVKVFETGKETLPVIFRLGFAWQLSNSVLGSVEFEKDLIMKPIYKAGLEYHFVKPVYFRFGFLTNPSQFTFGLGVELGKFNFDLASSYHPVLGYSPQASLIYFFN